MGLFCVSRRRVGCDMGTKQTIAWHQACLKNLEDSLRAAERDLAVQEARVADLARCVVLARAQIETAIVGNIDAFDAARFLVARKGRKG